MYAATAYHLVSVLFQGVEVEHKRCMRRELFLYCFRQEDLLFPAGGLVVSSRRTCCFQQEDLLFPAGGLVVSGKRTCCFRQEDVLFLAGGLAE